MGLGWRGVIGPHNYFVEMGSGSEEGSYLRLIDFVYHSTLCLRVVKKKKIGPHQLALSCTVVSLAWKHLQIESSLWTTYWSKSI